MRCQLLPGEHFCGNCGTQLLPTNHELKTLSATLGDEVDVQPLSSAQLGITLKMRRRAKRPPTRTRRPQEDGHCEVRLLRGNARAGTSA